MCRHRLVPYNWDRDGLELNEIYSFTFGGLKGIRLTNTHDPCNINTTGVGRWVNAQHLHQKCEISAMRTFDGNVWSDVDESYFIFNRDRDGYSAALTYLKVFMYIHRYITYTYIVY